MIRDRAKDKDYRRMPDTKLPQTPAPRGKKNAIFGLT
jgi:hypothetical protein